MMPVENPLISFCMSTYKRPGFLKEQLACILQQTYTNFEIIISDNDIEQSAKDVANCFNDKRIRYFANYENLGMIKSFNKSIERSQGDYILMITDDDPIYEDSLQTLVNLSIKYPNYGVYSGCGDWIIGNESASYTQKLNVGTHAKVSRFLGSEVTEIINSENFLYEYIKGKLSDAFLLWSCAIVRRKVMFEANCIPDYGSELLGDHAYMIVVSSQQGMVYINKSLGGQLVHGANFGYDFYKIENKFIQTPKLFFDYLKATISSKTEWDKNENLLWSFIGRGWVEYSLMLFHSLKNNRKTKMDFFIAFHKIFSNEKISKWKYKFYLKAYAKPLFKTLLFLKSKLAK